MSYQEMLEMWEKRHLPGFVTDLTPTVSRHRGDEIDAWLTECPKEWAMKDMTENVMYNNYKRGGGIVQTGIISQYVRKRSLHQA